MADRNKKWPKPWRLRWWPRDASERGLSAYIDSYHDTKEEAEGQAPLAPWKVEHESDCDTCGRSDVRCQHCNHATHGTLVCGERYINDSCDCNGVALKKESPRKGLAERCVARAKSLSSLNGLNEADAKALLIEAADKLEEQDKVIARYEQERVNVQNETRVITCAFCGYEYPPGTPTSNNAALAAHIPLCEKHPVGNVVRQQEHTIEHMVKAMEKGCTCRAYSLHTQQCTRRMAVIRAMEG